MLFFMLCFESGWCYFAICRIATISSFVNGWKKPMCPFLPKNAFLSHFLDLGIGWINAKFSEGGWHVYRVAPGLPGSDGCENSIRNIRIAGLGSINSENLLTKLCKSSRICLIHISRPASPDRCKSGSVSYIKHTAEFMLNLMCGEIRYPSGTGQTVMGKASGPHESSPGVIVLRVFYSNLAASRTEIISPSAIRSVRLVSVSVGVK